MKYIAGKSAKMVQTKPAVKNSSLELRARVVALRQAGISFAEIKRQTGKGRKFVCYWLKRAEGRQLLQDKKRSGRPPKLDSNDKKAITRLTKSQWNRGSRTVTKILNGSNRLKKQGKSVGRSTVLRYIRSQSWGKKAYVQPRKPMHTSKNISDRLRCCLKWKELGFCNSSRHGKRLRDNVLWTDESTIPLHPKPNRQNKRIRTDAPGEIESARMPKNGPKILVAGGMTATALTPLHIVPQGKSVDSKYYMQELVS